MCGWASDWVGWWVCAIILLVFFVFVFPLNLHAFAHNNGLHSRAAQTFHLHHIMLTQLPLLLRHPLYFTSVKYNVKFCEVLSYVQSRSSGSRSHIRRRYEWGEVRHVLHLKRRWRTGTSNYSYELMAGTPSESLTHTERPYWHAALENIHHGKRGSE